MLSGTTRTVLYNIYLFVFKLLLDGFFIIEANYFAVESSSLLIVK